MILGKDSLLSNLFKKKQLLCKDGFHGRVTQKKSSQTKEAHFLLAILE